MRNKRIFQRLESLKTKKASGKTLLAPEEFDLRFLEFSKTKSRVSGDLGSDHCNFHGPKAPKDWSTKESEKLINGLDLSVEAKIRFTNHIRDYGATLLSPRHELCTAAHASPLQQSITARMDSFDRDFSANQPSAYEFKDVCITFNLDSLKMSQRGIIIFDNTNTNPERCVPCPNPQMYKEWGQTECGIMWLHQINSLSSLGDYQLCYDENTKKISSHGQRQEPGENHVVKAGIFYPGTTLLLQFVQWNPGHQLWDYIASVVPVLRNEELSGTRIFDHTIVHQKDDCDDRIWVCAIFRKLGVFGSTKKDSLREYQENTNLIPLFDGVLTCFERLIAPIPGWNHDNSMLDKESLLWLRDAVTKVFGFRGKKPESVEFLSDFSEIPDQPYIVLLYPHNTPGEAGKRRAWLDVDKTFAKLNREMKDYVTSILADDFAKISVPEQAKLFYDADILVMSHGGQMGNSIFSRDGALIVEVTCGGYSHMQTGGGTFTSALGFLHIVYKPCICTEGNNDSSNYFLPLNEVLALVKLVLEDTKFKHFRINRGSVFISGKSLGEEICQG